MSSELRWQVFFSVWTRFHRLVIFGPTESFRYHRNMPLGATDFATGKTVCHLFYISSDPALLNESCPLQASQFYPLLCAESQGPNLYDGFQKALLGNWCQRGRERSHQSLSLREITSEREREYHLLRGRKRSPRGENTQVESISQGSQMLGVQEERCHMSSWGERHVHMCLFALALFIYIFQLWFSVPYLLPVSHARFRGSKTSKGRKTLNLLHIFTFGDMSIFNVVLSTHSTCHPSLGTLVVSFVCSGQ